MNLKPGDVIRHKAQPKLPIQIVTATIDPETNNLLVKGIYNNIWNAAQGIMTEFFIRPQHMKNWVKISGDDWKPII